MNTRTCSALSRLDVRFPTRRVRNASAPFLTVRPGPRPGLIVLANTLSQSRHVSTLAPGTESAKSKRSALRSNSRIVAEHRDLNSFLKYQNATGANLESKVALGTRYEYLIQRHLQDKLGFSLTRIGGKGDGGIDLIGTWTIPELAVTSQDNSALTPTSITSTAFRVFIQAKRLSPHRKPMPSLMRELEGTLDSSSSTRSISEAFQCHLLRKREEYIKLSASASECSNTLIRTSAASIADDSLTTLPTLAILITTNPLTVGTQAFMSGSRSPLMYMCLQEVDATEGSKTKIPTTSIQQITWNAAAAEAGLEGLNVGMRYAASGIDSGSSSTPLSKYAGSEAVLMRHGHPIQFASAQALAPT